MQCANPLGREADAFLIPAWDDFEAFMGVLDAPKVSFDVAMK
jgi:hypothetical protein